MHSALKTRLVNFKEFCRIVEDGQKADLIDGVIYMASPDNTDADQLGQWLGGLMFDFAQIKDLGRTTASRGAYRINEYQSPEPDNGLVSKRRLKLIKRGYVDGFPDLAVEIVSNDSIE